MTEEVDVLIIGGGPAGLAAGAACAELGLGSVMVLERESHAGGIPRHSQHTGYGLRDLRRVMTGPEYAKRWRDRAECAGVDVWSEHTVTELTVGGASGASGAGGGAAVWVTSPTGRRQIVARTLVLATGCRERPRSARLIPGDRPAGVYTTGTLQQLAYLEHLQPGTRAVVVGAEHVSFSAVVTLQHMSCDVVAMTTEHVRPTTFGAFDRAARLRWRFPVFHQTRLTQITGHGRVASVELTHQPTGRVQTLACDTVVLTGDWVADHELAVAAGLEMNSASTGPRVDMGSRTSAPGVFAIGNLTHPAETADVCALEGQAVAGAVGSWLADDYWPAGGVDIVVSEPLAWVSPSVISDAAKPARGRLVLRANTFRRAPRIQVTQADRVLWRRPIPWLVPTRPVYVPTPWLSRVDHTHGAAPVWVTVL